MEIIELLKTKIKYAKSIVFFGGAGVSTNSGIKDFRSKEGLYKLQSKYNKPYEVMLSHTYFYKHPDTFYQFYKEFMVNKDAKPNLAHFVLSSYQKNHHNLIIITQNIDALHQKAGSENVIELHGSIYRNYCDRCHRFYYLDDILEMGNPPRCSCGGLIKPDVVLYEEELFEDDLVKAINAIKNADILIVGGTSLNVYPAAGLIRFYKGNSLIIINKEETPFDSRADYVFHDDIGKILKLLLEE